MDSEHIRIITNLYNSDAMLEAHESLQTQPRNPEDPPDMEYAVAGIMLYSDATKLANFGSQSLWPIYLYIGNLSKYIRGKPSSFAAQHLAYIPSVSGAFVQ